MTTSAGRTSTGPASRPRPRSRWAAVPAALALGAWFGLPWLLKRVFAPPSRDTDLTPTDLGLPGEHVWLSSATGTRLHGWLVPVAGSAPLVIVVHGWGSNAAQMLPLGTHLHAAGIHALFLDARNHGLSEHDRFTSMPRFAEDLEAAIAWAHDDPRFGRIGVIGHSVGAGAAILTASRDDRIDAVVAVATPAHPGELMRTQLSRLPAPVTGLLLRMVQRVIGHRFDAFAPQARIGLVSVPVLLVHGTADPIVPIDDLYRLAAANPGAEMLAVAGAGHGDLAAFEPHVPEIVSFLDALAAGGVSDRR